MKVKAILISCLTAFSGFAQSIQQLNPEEIERELANIRAKGNVVEKPQSVEPLRMREQEVIYPTPNPFLKVINSSIYKQLKEIEHTVQVVVNQNKDKEKVQKEGTGLGINQTGSAHAQTGSAHAKVRRAKGLIYDYGYCSVLNNVVITPMNLNVPIVVSCMLKHRGKTMIEGEVGINENTGALVFKPLFLVSDYQKVPIKGRAYNRQRTSENIASYVNTGILERVLSKSAYESGEIVLKGIEERFKNAGRTVITEGGTVVVEKPEIQEKEILRTAGFSFVTSLYKELGASGVKRVEMTTPLYKIFKGDVFYIEVMFDEESDS